MGFRHNRLQWGFLVCHAGFILLADCAPMHIVFGEFFHSFAFVCLAKEMSHVQYSGVACEWMVVVQSQDFALLFDIFGELNLGEACGRE